MSNAKVEMSNLKLKCQKCFEKFCIRFPFACPAHRRQTQAGILVSGISGCFHHNAADDVGCIITSIRRIAVVPIDPPHLKYMEVVNF
jgi:hypothetical protein